MEGQLSFHLRHFTWVKEKMVVLGNLGFPIDGL